MDLAVCLLRKCKNCKNAVNCFKEDDYIGKPQFKNAKSKNKRSKSSKIQSKKKTRKK